MDKEVDNVPLFCIRDMRVSYANHEVLRDISTDIPDKQVTSLLGPSGCGKSTILRVLNRTLELTPSARISKGNVHFRGEDLLNNKSPSEKIRKKIGIVQQRPVPFPMSIKDNVMFGADFHHKKKKVERDIDIKGCLERVNLWSEVKDRLHSQGSSLSIGQQQRLCIARSLANNPDVLLMDEPCSALDPTSTAKIEELIMDLKKTIPIVIVTHNLAQARRVSTHCLFFLDGTIAEQGSTDMVLDNPEHHGVKAIVSGRNG